MHYRVKCRCDMTECKEAMGDFGKRMQTVGEQRSRREPTHSLATVKNWFVGLALNNVGAGQEVRTVVERLLQTASILSVSQHERAAVSAIAREPEGISDLCGLRHCEIQYPESVHGFRSVASCLGQS